MAKFEISDVTFIGLVTVGMESVQHWGSKQPAHSPTGGTQSCREIRGDRGETLAVVITYEAGNVLFEIEVPAANIRCIVRKPVAEPAAEKPGAKGGAK